MSERIPPFQGLFYFYTAAETGSFKLAAERLFVTPAAISQQIRLLEEWLGAELFIRQHRKILRRISYPFLPYPRLLNTGWCHGLVIFARNIRKSRC